MSLSKILQGVALAGAASVTSVAFAQSSNMSEVVERTVISNPEVRARFQDFQSTMEGQNVVQGGLLPEVTAQGWVGREWRGSTSETQSDRWGRSGYSMQLRQIIFDGSSTINNVKTLSYEKLSGYYNHLATVEYHTAAAA